MSWPPKWLTHDVEETSTKAQLAIEFVEVYGVITKDSVSGRAGSRLVLRDWQRDIIRNLYAQGDDKSLLRPVALVGLPRKNGKSALASHLAVFDLFFGPRGGETYSVAATRDQARIVFGEAKKIIEADPELAGMVKLYRDAIEYKNAGSVYRVLSAESGGAEGLNSSAVWFDELHAQPNRKMFDVMSLSMGARGPEAHMVAITTAGVRSDTTGRDGIAYSLYQMGQKIAQGEVDDPSFFMAWWEASEGADHREPETWRVANPGFGDLNAESDFHAALRRTPESEFRIKRCNQWVSAVETWLPAGAWDECAADFTLDPDAEIILGFDGSYNGDASVIVGAVVPESADDLIRVFMVKAWEKDLDNDPVDWRVDIGEVEATISEFCRTHRVREIACDPFRWARSMEVLENQGLPVVAFPQSPQRMIRACAIFFDAVAEKRLQHDSDPLLTRHIGNTATKLTPAGPHIKKENPNSPRKIDAAVAAILAVDRASGGKIEVIVPEFFG